MKKFFISAVFVLAALFVFRDVVQITKATVACSVPFVFVNGQPADATQVNANFNSLVACFGSAASAGANSDITSLTGLTTPLTPAQGGAQYYWGGTGGGTANAQTVTTVTPSSGLTLTQGVTVSFIPNVQNTGATTLNVNGTGVQPVRRQITSTSSINASGTLVGGELSGPGLNVVTVTWGGTSWILQNQGAFIPGEIRDMAYAGCPIGWAEANAGSSTGFTDYNGAVGSTWGSNLFPDLRGRGTFGRDSGGSGRITAGGGNFDGTVVGNTGGGQNQTLTQAQLPNFNLTIAQQTALVNIITSSLLVNNQVGTGTANTAISFGTGALNNFNFTAIESGFATLGTSNPSCSGSIGGGNRACSLQLGSGNAHTILAPAGIVTKCVKL